MGERRTNVIVGAAALLVVVVLGYFLVQFLGGSYESGFEVNATFARAGQLLRATSDVKLRGVLVGSVSQIRIQRNGKARVTLRLFEHQMIPSNVEAAVRAKTLFGEKFIELRIPRSPSATQLRAGGEIPESRTTPPFEVETILEKGVPILEAVDPQAFGAALHALAEAFVGNEQHLRRATLQSEKLLTATERTLPNLERNLVHLKHFAAALDSSDTELLDGLRGLTAVGEVIRDHPQEFRRTLGSLVPLARDLGDVLTARQKDLGDLAGKGAPVLRSLQARAPKLPALVDSLNGFLAVWIADMSEGPYWRIVVTNPDIVLGEPYAPGTEPKPRTAAIARLSTPRAPAKLLDVVLAPVPTRDLSRTPASKTPHLLRRTPR